METRSLAQKVLILVVVMILALSLLTQAQGQEIVWKCQTVLNPGHMATDSQIMLASEVEKRTNGKLKINMFHGVGLGLPPARMLGTVGAGVLDSAEIWGGHVSGDLRILEILNLHGIIPFDIPLRKKAIDILFPYFEKALREKFNIKLIYGWQAEPRHIYTKRQVTRFTDMKGMKIRAEGIIESEISKAIGITPLTVPSADIYMSMQQGVLDGTWWAPSPAFLGRLYEVSKYCLEMNADGSSGFFIINLDKFKALPPEYQKILMEVGEECKDYFFRRVKDDLTLYNKKFQDMGVIYTRPHPEDLKFVDRVAPKAWESWLKDAEPEAREMVSKVRSLVADWEKGRK